MTEQRQMVDVTFLPDSRSVKVPVGTRLSAAGAAAGVIIDAPCGDRGVCGKCRVQVRGEVSHLTASEAKSLPRDLVEDGWRLACQATVAGPCSVFVPRAALQIAVDGLGREIALRPNAQRVRVSLPEADIADARAAFARLRDTLGRPELRIGVQALRSLAGALPAPNGLTVSLVGEECVGVTADGSAARCFGLAFDIGTTTVVGALVDLTTGHEVAVSATLNEQSVFGADVISRIKLAIEDPTGLERLSATIVRVLNKLIDDLLSRSGARREEVLEVTLVGNTCMHHLVLGVSPASLGEAPYAAVVQEAVVATAGEVGLDLGPAARVYVLPVIAGHVGADTVGVILATGLHHSEEVRLAIDIGTNGEIALGSRQRLVACSTAAGPAFEGTAIRHGMRATTGAIQGARIDGDLEVSVVGGVGPTGICGSGLIDVVAELRLAGLVDENGRLAAREEAPTGTSEALLDRLIEVDGERAFRLSGDEGPLVVLTQRDVRELQLAKGAIAAGVQILKRVLDVSDDEIAGIELAGAFGSYIRQDSARTIGLIPSVPLERVRSVGNAARVGARLALISTDARAEAEEIARSAEHQELFARSDFFEEYMESMRFPALG